MPNGIYDLGLVSTDPLDARKLIGNGTGWLMGGGNVRAGDVLERAGATQAGITIESVESDEGLTFPYDWFGPALDNVSYVVRQSSPDRNTVAQLNQSISDMIARMEILAVSSANISVKQHGVNIPPLDYGVGERLVVGTVPTGEFGGHSNEFAIKTLNGWGFTAPEHGWISVEQVTNVARVWSPEGGWTTAGGLLGSPLWAGVWDIETAYKAGEVVSRLGKTYAADVDNTGFAPEANPTKWSPFADLGEHGGALNFSYKFRTALTPEIADVAGQLNLDNIPGSATRLYINTVDVFGNDWSARFDAINAATASGKKGNTRLKVPGDGTRQFIASVLSATLVDTHYELVLDEPTAGLAALLDNSDIIFFFDEKGVQGDPGDVGLTGPMGSPGGAVVAPYTFDGLNFENADPGSGKLRLNLASQYESGIIRADLLNSAGGNMTNSLDSILGASTSAVKVHGRLYHAVDHNTKFIDFRVVNVLTEVGHRNIVYQVTGYSSQNPFTHDDPLILDLGSPKGDKGDTATVAVGLVTRGLPGDDPSVDNSGTPEDGIFNFVLPPGESFVPQIVVPTLAARAAYDVGPVFDENGQRLSVLVEEDESRGGASILYFLVAVDPAEWSIGTPFSPNSIAAAVSFDPAVSGMTSTNVQTALDEVSAAADEAAELAIIFGD